MITCGACGTGNEDNAIFCIECGGSIFEDAQYDDIMSHQGKIGEIGLGGALFKIPEKTMEKTQEQIMEEFEKWRQDPAYTPILNIPKNDDKKLTAKPDLIKKDGELYDQTLAEFLRMDEDLVNEEIAWKRGNDLLIKKEIKSLFGDEGLVSRLNKEGLDGRAPYSPITRRDVRKGIGGRKLPNKKRPIKDMTMTKSRKPPKKREKRNDHIISKRQIPPKTTENPYIIKNMSLFEAIGAPAWVWLFSIFSVFIFIGILK